MKKDEKQFYSNVDVAYYGDLTEMQKEIIIRNFIGMVAAEKRLSECTEKTQEVIWKEMAETCYKMARSHVVISK